MTFAIQNLEEARSNVRGLELRVLALRARQSELASDIDEAADQAKRGSLPGTRILNAIATEKTEVDAELQESERALRAAEVDLRRMESDQARTRFNQVLAEITQQKSHAVELIRNAAIALGKIVDLQKQAAVLCNGPLATAPVGHGAVGCWPADVTLLRQALQQINPYDKWNAAEYLPVDVDAGTIRIQPVRIVGTVTTVQEEE